MTFLVDNNSRLAIVRPSLVVWNQFSARTEGLDVAAVQKRVSDVVVSATVGRLMVTLLMVSAMSANLSRFRSF